MFYKYTLLALVCLLSYIPEVSSMVEPEMSESDLKIARAEERERARNRARSMANLMNIANQANTTPQLPTQSQYLSNRYQNLPACVKNPNQ